MVNVSVTHMLHTESEVDSPCTLGHQLQAFWELEALGIQEEERTLYDDFAAEVRFEHGRYKVSLPWREFHEPLPDNYQLSVSRQRLASSAEPRSSRRQGVRWHNLRPAEKEDH